jgi:hypothetical protein
VAIVTTTGGPKPKPASYPSVSCKVAGFGGCADSMSPPATPSFATTTAAAPTTQAAPVAAWTPCDTTKDSYNGGCKELVEDSCDGAYASNQDGDLLDAFIENRLLVDPNRLKDCPQFLPTWQKSLTGFTEGVVIIGKDVKPGTYETTSYMTGGKVVDCYWERSQNGQIIANNFVSGASKVTVTIHSGDDAFTSRHCGDWIKVG